MSNMFIICLRSCNMNSFSLFEGDCSFSTHVYDYNTTTLVSDHKYGLKIDVNIPQNVIIEYDHDIPQ